MPTDKKNRETLLIAGIFALALILRIGYLLFLRKNYFFYDYPSDDVTFYQAWATRIQQEGWLGKSVFNGMPLYPYFLSVLKGLTLNHEFFIRLAHLILGSVNCSLIYPLTREVFGKKTAVLASVLAATDFMLIYYDWLMMPVTLIISLSLIVLLGLSQYDEKTPRSKWAILGIFVGLGTLGDGKFLIFLVLLLAYYFWRHKNTLQSLTKTLLPLCLGVAVILLGTGLRNQAVSGDFVPLSAHGGLNFYIGNNPQATGFFENPSFLRPTHDGHAADQKILAEAALNRRLSPKEVSLYWQNRAFSFVAESPRQFAALLSKKFSNFWKDTEFAYDIDLLMQRDWKNRFNLNSFWIIIPLALLGAGIAARQTPKILPLIFLIASQLIFTLIFFLINRHRVTVLPFLIILEAYFLVWAFEQAKRRNFQPVFPMLAVILIFLWINRPVSISGQTLEFLKATKTGFILADKGRASEAKGEYYRALKFRPFDSNTLYNLANIYVIDGNLTEAIKLYERATAVDPANPDILYNLAFSYEKAGFLAQAQSAYAKVIELSPESLDARFRLANILRRESRCAEAVRHYEFIKNVFPRLATELTNLINSCKN